MSNKWNNIPLECWNFRSGCKSSRVSITVSKGGYCSKGYPKQECENIFCPLHPGEP
jgi:hypothetical protein